MLFFYSRGTKKALNCLRGGPGGLNPGSVTPESLPLMLATAETRDSHPESLLPGNMWWYLGQCVLELEQGVSLSMVVMVGIQLKFLQCPGRD